MRKLRRIAVRIVFVRGAQRVHDLVRDHHAVAAVHVGPRECVHHADHALEQSGRMRHRLVVRRIMIEHEHAHVGRLMRAASLAPRPEAQLQAPPHRRQRARARLAHGRQGIERRLQAGLQGHLDLHTMRVRLRRKEPVDIGETLCFQPPDVAARDRRCVGRDGVHRHEQRHPPLRAADMLAPAAQGDQEQNDQQRKDAQGPKGFAPGLAQVAAVGGGALQSAESADNSSSSPSWER
jgi:hypothetical protein